MFNTKILLNKNNFWNVPPLFPYKCDEHLKTNILKSKLMYSFVLKEIRIINFIKNIHVYVYFRHIAEIVLLQPTRCDRLAIGSFNHVSFFHQTKGHYRDTWIYICIIHAYIYYILLSNLIFIGHYSSFIFGIKFFFLTWYILV